MAKRSFLNRLGKWVREAEVKTSEDIDREVESAIQTIGETEVESLAADDVLGGGWGEAGEMVYIMDLAPVYGLIGGHSERLTSATKIICKDAFSKQVIRGRGRTSFMGDRFFMRFAGASDTEGFQRAAIIVNDIGTRILGGRFRTIEVPGLLVAVESADITSKDGSLNLEKAAAAVRSGGRPLAMDEPAADDPLWLKLHWKRRLGGGEASSGGPVATAPDDPARDGGSGPASRPDGPDWRLQSSRSGSKGQAWLKQSASPRRDPSQWVQRRGQDRREAIHPFSGKDQRQSFDRRGRGY